MKLISLLLVFFLLAGCSQFPDNNILYCQQDSDCFCNCCQKEIIEGSICGLYSQLNKNSQISLVECDFSNCLQEGYKIKCVQNSCVWINSK